MLNCLGRELWENCRWVISDVVGHLLCSKTAIPVWNGIFYSSFKPSVSSGQDVYTVVLKGMIFLFQMYVLLLLFVSLKLVGYMTVSHLFTQSFAFSLNRCKWTAGSWGVGLAFLCHSFMKKLFCLPNVHICAVLASWNIINYITVYGLVRIAMGFKCTLNLWLSQLDCCQNL